MDRHELKVEVSKHGASLKQTDGGPILLASREQWEKLLAEIKAGKYDLPAKK